MYILLVRHGIAVNSAKTDELRPLSAEGQQKTTIIAQGIKIILPQLDHIISSPLLRAQQTADILAKAYTMQQFETIDALAPGGDYALIIKHLSRYSAKENIALVGHEPDLGMLAAWLLTGTNAGFIPLKKASACLLEFQTTAQAGAASLNCYLTPKQLLKLAELRKI